jgi:C-terminal processing protease CtpA/Prc
MKPIKLGILAVCIAVLTACGGGNGEDTTDTTTTDCRVVDQNGEIQLVMEDWYLKYTQLKLWVNPELFRTPAAFLQELVSVVDFVPGDPQQEDRYSYIITEAEEQQIINAAFVGFGFSFRIVNSDQVQLLQVFGEYAQETENSPASRAGLKRGQKILEIDGVPVADIIAADPHNPVAAVSRALGPRQVGITRVLKVDKAAGQVTVTLVKEDLLFNTVPLYKVFDVNGSPVGYFYFRSFAEPAFTELEAAFGYFIQEGVEDVIVDVRYNGGGLLSVASFLGNLLGGSIESGQIFSKIVYNIKQSHNNETAVFAQESQSLSNLRRLVFITTSNSASASEMVLNAMRSYVAEMAVVGSTSYGKPVGSLGFSICGGLVLRPATFKTVNADDYGDYFDGIAADCVADDDPNFALGDPLEDSLAAALSFIETGSCPVVPSPKAAAIRGMQQAFKDQIRRLDPGRLERNFD